MSLKLNSGYEMPLVGFGTWKVSNDTVADQVYNAIKVGYRLFDCAQDYGNEKEVGQGLKRAIDDGLVSRDELFITSKLWNTYHDPKNLGKAFDKGLSDLGLEYIDLYLIHFPISLKYVPIEEKYPPGLFSDGKVREEKVPILDTWRAMEELVESKKVRSIGISNFATVLIQDLLKAAKIPPAVLQIEHHPYLQQPTLVKYVQRWGIQITGYSSFGPQSFLEMGHSTALETPTLFEHTSIKSIADKHEKSPAQVLLRWATQRGIAVIPKSGNPDRLFANLHVNDFDLTEQDLVEISKLEKGIRFNDPTSWGDEGFPIFY